MSPTLAKVSSNKYCLLVLFWNSDTICAAVITSMFVVLLTFFSSNRGLFDFVVFMLELFLADADAEDCEPGDLRPLLDFMGEPNTVDANIFIGMILKLSSFSNSLSML